MHRSTADPESTPAGECGVCSSSMELRCLLMLVAQAAWSPEQRPLVGEVVRGMGSRLGYPDPPAYMAYHFLPLAHNWLSDLRMALCDLKSVWVSDGLPLDFAFAPQSARLFDC